MPPSRVLIAETVHRVVAEATGTDGYGFCALYAIVGRSLAEAAFGPGYILQSGTMRLLVAPPDGWLTLRTDPDRFAAGQYHAWFARPATGNQPAEIVDLSSRHYAGWADSNRDVLGTGGQLLRWSWPMPPPSSIWQDGLTSDWVGLVATAEATHALGDWEQGRRASLAPILRLAHRRWRSTRENNVRKFS